MANVISVAVWGALGTVVRWFVIRVFPMGSSGIPWGVLTVNVLGSFLAGYIFASKIFQGRTDLLSSQVLLVGFLGGFTTFSAFSLDSVRLIEESSIFMALANVALNNVLSLCACYMGMRLVNIM